MKHSILCVDDETDNVDALERLFRRKYQVFKANSGAEALKVLQQNKVSVIISDQRMPQMTGVELLAASIKTHPNAIRILLTGYTDIDSVVAAINSGQIYRYVTKPWDPVDLVNAVDKAVDRYEIGELLVEKNQALEAALEELKTLDQAKNQFMVLVNHELKTPLTSILSFTDLLSETSLDPEQAKMLSRVKTSALRLQDMVTDALEFVSAETGQIKVEKKAIATRTVFQMDALPETLQKQAQDRGLKIHFGLENVKVIGDEKILRNVFRRLIHNAVKFAEADSEIDVMGREGTSARFELAITNRGKPIPAKQIAHILKPFTLNENVLNHSVGTGMGLGICQAYLKLHNSSLNFDCREGLITVSFELDLK